MSTVCVQLSDCSFSSSEVRGHPRNTRMKFRKTKDEEPTAPGQVRIKKRSRVPGVMITQFVEEIPEGSSHPDFTRKPIALTLQEGKLAVFKAIVTGNPAPTVTWKRSNGEIDPELCQSVYDEHSHEHQLQMPAVGADLSDTYKCFAVNEFGQAVVTAALNVIEVGFKKSKAMKEAREEKQELAYTTLLKTRAERPKEEKKDGELDENFWELLLSADKKDYESICAQYGITDFRGMLTKLKVKKQERMEEQAQFISHLSNLKPIEVKSEGNAEFEFEMDLKDPNSRIFLYKDGVMVPFTSDLEEKHCLKQVGKKFVFSVKDLNPEDAGMYQVDVEGVNIFSTDFKVPAVDFVVKIQEVKAMEREDAVFECVVSQPLEKMSWFGKNVPLAQGEKYDIEVSEDKLIHRLVVKDCLQLDKGIYAAVAGIKSCNAWLVVEADNDPSAHGKKKARKTTTAGGSGVDLAKIAAEQNEKIQAERAEMMEKVKQAQEEAAKLKAEQEPLPEPAPQIPASKAEEPAAETAAPEKPTEQPAKPTKTIVKTTKKVVKKTVKKTVPKPAPAPAAEGVEAVPEPAESETIEVEEEVEVEEVVEEVVEEQAVEQVEEEEEEDGDGEKKKRVRTGPLVPETVIDPGVYFTCGLSDASAIMGQSAELVCKLSSEDCEGVWYKDGIELTSSEEGPTVIKEGAYHKLVIRECTEEDAGKYRFEADGRKTEAMLIVEDPPRISPEDLAEFSEPVIIKAGKSATFKINFVGREPIKVQWYNEDEEVLDDTNIKIEKSSTHSRLLLSKCPRKQTGEIKIKLKNEFGTAEAISKLIVIDKPTPPAGPVEIVEASANCVEIKWRGPKDDGGCTVDNYNLERQQLGRNTWKKIGLIPGVPHYKDTDVDHGRKYCYRIRAITAEGASEIMMTDDIQAGTKAYPGPPSQPKVVSAFKDCINLSWSPPTNTGGTNILGYNLEKRKRGSNLWGPVNPVNEPIKAKDAKEYGVKDVVEGIEYEFRVSAINVSGAGEASTPSEFVFARDPKKPPGKVSDLKVTDSTYTSLSLGWSKPKEEEGVQDEAKGYYVELRPAEETEWTRCNSNALITTSYTIIGLKSMAMYWVRVVASNEGGDGEPRDLDNYIIAMPPPVRPTFTDRKMKSFMVVRAGNSTRVNINFMASPMPNITWLKDGMPIPKRITISNAEGTSQILIPSSERTDTGIYSIILKNIVGQETFSTEIRVTDEPKPPGPIELEQNVPGTVTVSWTASPDEKRDDRLYYIVMKRDSVKRTWQTVAERVFNNNYTLINIMPGREYYFRVYAKNDMGQSDPSESRKWEVVRKKEKFTLNMPETKNCTFDAAPSFTVPLRTRSSPESYECYMSCAVSGNPAPYITWFRNNVSINTDTNYFISNTCGVCSLLILKVGPKDNGEYKIMAENQHGRAECTTKLTVRD
ncbi:immunoglobulin-like and fibronectin type III domain-containing protein 1 [Engraulis encrasicolus]|uniref:immunoglobulin-like and fibronectin type III domain-containing protein 1 n=1 Tax=Engraulis encrasicolus TaxID=184585 RepID=UPI002FCEB576